MGLLSAIKQRNRRDDNDPRSTEAQQAAVPDNVRHARQDDAVAMVHVRQSSLQSSPPNATGDTSNALLVAPSSTERATPHLQPVTSSTLSAYGGASTTGQISFADSQSPLIATISGQPQPFSQSATTDDTSTRNEAEALEASSYAGEAQYPPKHDRWSSFGSAARHDLQDDIAKKDAQPQATVDVRSIHSHTKKRKRLWRKFTNPVATVASNFTISRQQGKDTISNVRPPLGHLDSLPAASDSSQSTNSLQKADAKVPDGNATGGVVEHTLSYGDGKGKEGVLRRVYDAWDLTAVGVANIGPLQGVFFGVFTAKEYGGYSVLALGWPLSGMFMCLFSAVIAEFASSYPVAGAMYTWTFRLCRLSPTLRPLARFLSWLAGSFLLCGHILAQLLIEWQYANTMQGLVMMYVPEYEPSTWRAIAFAWAGLILSGLLASSSAGRSPYLWKGYSVLFLATTLICIIAILTSNNLRNPASVMFTSYANMTGFTSKGYVYLLGWMLTSIATGQDVAAHLAEEAKYPTRTVPRGVFWSTAISYLSGWAVMLAIMTVLPEGALDDDARPRNYGAPAIILGTLLPRPAAFALLFLLIVLMLMQDTAQLLASSRFIWALARDKALPASPFFRVLSPSRIPRRATIAVCVLVFLSLMLLATDRKIATSLMLQGCGASILFGYCIPVWSYLTCAKGALDTDGRNEWTLRGWSQPAAWLGSTYIVLIVIMMACPTDWPISRTTFSYASPIVVAVILASSLTWVLYGNSHYAGPIKSITVYTIGREVELPKSTHQTTTNRQTPHSGRPTATPVGVASPGLGVGGATTGVDFGKTANLYSESLVTIEHDQIHDQRQMETWDSRGGISDFTDTQMTGRTDDSYSYDSESEEEGQHDAPRLARSLQADLETGTRPHSPRQSPQRSEPIPHR